MQPIQNIDDRTIEEKAIIKDMLKYSPSKIFGMIGNALIIPIYTSLLSPEEYGLYSISIILLSFLCIIFSDWVGLSGLRFFRQFQIKQNLSDYLSVLVSILLINISIMFVLTFTFKNQIYSFFHIPKDYFLAILFLIIPVAIRALLFQILRAQIKPIAFTISTILYQILTILFSVIYIKTFNLGAMSLLIGMGTALTIIDILLIFQSKIYKYFRRPQLHWSIILPIAIYGLPIAATSLSTWVINQSNKFIMNSISGFEDAGYVGVAYGATFPIFLTIFSIITVAAIPRIIKMYEDKIDVKPTITKFTGYYLLFSLPIITVVAIYSPDFLHLLAHKNFEEAQEIIPYFAFGAFFMGLTDYSTLQYHLANKTYIDFGIKLISGLVGIVLNLLLIPRFGLTGVGIATLSANLIYFLLSTTINIKDLGLQVSRKLLLDICFGFIFMFFIQYFINKIANIPTIIEIISLLAIFYIFYFYSKIYLFRKLQ